MVRYAGFCVTRYARGAGGITSFRAAYNRDLPQDTVSFAEPVLFKILAPEHRGLSSGKTLHKGDTAWEKGIWFGKSQTNPEHMVGIKSGAMGARMIRRLEPTKLSETSFLLEIQDVPKDLVPNAPRRGRRKKHLTTAPALPPVHGNLTDDKSGSSSDRMSSSSSSPQALSGILQHANVRAQAQTNSRSQQQKAIGGECSCCAVDSVGLWYVAVVHRFHMGPTLLEVMSTSLSASAVTGMTVAAGVFLAS